MSLTPEALSGLRQEYTQNGLRRNDLDADPLVLFRKWLSEAQQVGVLEPNAMVLSTVDLDGKPWSRVVLLKVCDEHGFAFFTNYRGAKAVHLLNEPRAALTFWWGALERQVNITGRVSKTSRDTSERYFASRPRASQLGAWVSQQSSVITGRAELEEGRAQMEQQFDGKDVECPVNWGGYVLEPETIEFWQGRQSRLHDRFRFSREGAISWKVERLAP
ncbi:MAG: pyridoxamine 5'-phosphate oxidase [Verrucomicrobiota bacterium]